MGCQCHCEYTRFTSCLSKSSQVIVARNTMLLPERSRGGASSQSGINPLTVTMLCEPRARSFLLSAVPVTTSVS